MAVSDAFSTSNQYIKYKITVTEGSIDIPNNTSTVSVTVNFYRTNTGYSTYGKGTVYCKINETTYSASVSSNQKITSSGINLFSKTVTIPHDSDGNKTLRVAAWITHTQFSSSEQGFDIALTSIPRATTPILSASTVNLGSSITITLNRAANTFTHNLTYVFGNLSNQTSGFNEATSVETSTTFVPPLALAIQIPNATSGVLTITCNTYNGTTLIGTKSISLTVNVPSSLIPSFGSIPISATETVSGIATKFSGFVQNISKILVSVSALGSYGSTISTYKVTVDGQTYNSKSFTTEKIISSGNIVISATITDSRGRTNTATLSITVIEYNFPTISSFKAFRCSSDGTENPEGNRIKAEFAFEISPVNNLNDKYYEIVYRERGTTNWNAITSGSLYSFNGSIVSGEYFSPDKPYDVAINLRDYLSNNTATGEIPTAFTILDFRSTGKGLAMGKVSEKDCLEIALDVDLTGKFLQEETQTPTLLNGWMNYDATYAPAGYWKDAMNIVHLSGMIKSGATAAETVIFSLPVGYRPASSEKFFTVSLNAICTIDIYSNGNVVIRTGANAGWVSLSGITFRAN